MTEVAQISYQRSDIIVVLRTLNELVVSLGRIGSRSSEVTKTQFEANLARFVIERDVTGKLAHARRVLSAAFDDRVGADGLDELERLMQDVEYWGGDVA